MKQVHYKVLKQFLSKLQLEITEKIFIQVWNQLDDQLDDQVRFQVYVQVRSSKLYLR